MLSSSHLIFQHPFQPSTFILGILHPLFVIQFNSRWIKSSPVVIVFSLNILFRSDMSVYLSKMAFANSSVDFNYTIHLCNSFIFISGCLGSFIVWSIHLLCQHFLAAWHKTFLLNTHTNENSFTPHISFWKWRQKIWTAPLALSPALHRQRGFVCLWANASYCRKSHETLDSNCTAYYLFSFCRRSP